MPSVEGASLSCAVSLPGSCSLSKLEKFMLLKWKRVALPEPTQLTARDLCSEAHPTPPPSSGDFPQWAFPGWMGHTQTRANTASLLDLHVTPA